MNANSHDLPSALERIDEILNLAAGRPFALFLDYDGTLTPIVERPELAVFSAEMRDTVRQLAESLPVAVISGRELHDVKRLVGIDSIYYAGSHGFEIEGPGGWHLDSRQVAEFLPRLDSAERILAEELSEVPGALIERKRFSVAAHYRLVSPDRLEQVNSAVERALAVCPELRRTSGKKVFELQPRLDWNKGKALLWLLDALKLDPASTLPIFLGDDITDEDAFAALRDIGVGVIVRDEPRDTAARYALDSTGEVRAFLSKLLAGAR